MKLLVVESPTKCPKIRRLLQAYEPGQWQVVATAGHWRGLPEMAGQDFREVVDPVRGFAESFVVHPDKRSIEKQLRESIRAAAEIYIATDDDREGEAIAWHLIEHFGLRSHRRVRCREITAKGVTSGIRNAGFLDVPLVEAQRARTVVDYLIGMEVSRLIWRFDCRSAGRLQSTALRILAERERAREAFTPEKFWTLQAEYGGGLNAVIGAFEVLDVGELDAEDGLADDVRLAPMRFDSHPEAEGILRELRSARHVVEAVEQKPRTRNPPPPLTTSDLLGTASSRLGFPSEKTSQLAQSLFEKGAITYIRTDSTALADDAVLDIRSYLGAHHGKLLPDERVLAPVAHGAQAAHEAIRPTKMTRVPRAEMGLEESALYDLVFVRTLCSQAKPAVIDRTVLTVQPVGRPWRLLAHGSVVREAGWTELDPEVTIADTRLPEIEVGQELQLAGADVKEHRTKSPPRFTEQSLIRYLERRGIGRPSTYVEMLRKLRDRGYVETRGTELVPLELGLLADELVTLGFDLLTQEDFTANTEKALDAIAAGELQRVEFLEAFFGKFQRLFAEAEAAFATFAAKHPELDRDAVEEHGDPCPKCGSTMMARRGKTGRYAKCTSETCGQVVSLEPPNFHAEPCPSCGDKVREQPYTKDGKRKVLFVCQAECGWKSGFAPPKTGKEPCPKCGGRMLLKSGSKGEFFGCLNYPKCDGARPIPKQKTRRQR